MITMTVPDNQQIQPRDHMAAERVSTDAGPESAEGMNAQFATTHWSVVLATGDDKHSGSCALLRVFVATALFKPQEQPG